MTTSRRIPPRWLRRTLVVIALLFPCVLWGVTSAQVDAGLGPHEARYDVTTSGLVVLDFGPLGTLQIDSPLPLRLGVLVTVEEIPADLTAVGQAESLDSLSHDLDAYLAFFASPGTTISAVAHDLVVDALRRTALAVLLVGAGSAGLVLLLGAARRREVSAALAPRTYEITAGLLVVVLVGATLTGSDPDSTGGTSRPASAVFAGTPLEGARITGRLGGIVDTYGSIALDLLRENDEFYAEADANLATAWDRRAAIQDVLAASADPPGPGGSTDTPAGPGPAAENDAPTGDPTDESTGADGTDPSPEEDDDEDGAAGQDGAAAQDEGGDRGEDGATSGATTTPDDELVTLLMISDLHCNTGMTPLIRTAAERSGASIVLNAGDTTMNGTGVESFCVDSFASAVPQGVQTVVADGNHDSVETAQQWRSNGAIELDGSVVDVEGIRILGDRDPLESRIGEGSKPAREETPAQYAARLADTACELQESGDPIDLMMIHTPRMGNDALDSGCVPSLLAGHMHTRDGPDPYGYGVRYVSGSTAGAVADQLRIGPLKGTAEMTVLRFDPVERRIVDWQLVQVATDATAKVWPRIAWPRPVAPGDEENQPGDESLGTEAGTETGTDAPTAPATSTEEPAGDE
ncbi:metallophosphoesterase family protein [Cellulosimicrobium arenosum]|uniref:Metallophosphoesterase n=1 Tax=Cellulosimicrobium arenosum TaxID=2708133 RepID=A0A927J2N2_9MICO|nr:metallophosphoesterase [Cellulosimicrobium arenosum]MBD8080752.1 metallophosphoesterase [Cellulosimicrobium arenosum]